MTDAKSPAFPTEENVFDDKITDAYGLPIPLKRKHHGLTKRELFAAMAMQGIVANQAFMEFVATQKNSELATIQSAISFADALIARLKETPDEGE